MAPKSPRLRVLALEMREGVLRTVQLGLKKKAKAASRLLHPVIVKERVNLGNK